MTFPIFNTNETDVSLRFLSLLFILCSVPAAKINSVIDNKSNRDILPTMAARKKETDFNEYFDSLWEYARTCQMSKGQFMKVSDLSPQRFSEFSQKTRNITGEYFLKMLGGLGLTPEELERISERPYSEEQMSQLRFDSFIKSQRSFLEDLMKDPAIFQICKAIVKSKGLLNNRYAKKLLSKFTDWKTY
jgi:hypothetical protein